MEYDDIICQRIYKLSMKNLDGTKYLYFNMIIGCIAGVFRQSRVPVINPIPEKYIDTFLDAIYDHFYGGCEPEFETEEQYNQFQETIKNIKEDLIWSTPKYSTQLNKLLFPNGCQTFPSICRLSEVTKNIQYLHSKKDDNSRWNRGDKSNKELYDEFYGYI